MTYETASTSPAASLALGERFGRHLPGGLTVELISDLGGGKTVLVKGIAKGLGYLGEVSSPTFTISRIYQLPDGRELHHFDFYRLAAGDIVAQELAEVTGQPDIIVAIEWAGNAGDVLPADRLQIKLAVDEAGRRDIKVTGTGPKSDKVVEAIK